MIKLIPGIGYICLLPPHPHPMTTAGKGLGGEGDLYSLNPKLYGGVCKSRKCQRFFFNLNKEAVVKNDTKELA